MGAALRIGRLATRIRAGEPQARDLSEQVRAALAGPLRRAFGEASERALAQAGLPAGALVAVRRLRLRLRVGEEPDPSALASAWARSFGAALERSLSDSSGDAFGGEPELVWFPDIWAAERAHLGRLALGRGTAWWLEAVLGEREPDPGSLLARWLDRDPGRALVLMSDLALSGLPVAGLLDGETALAVCRVLLGRLALRAVPAEPPPPSEPGPGSDDSSHAGPGAGRAARTGHWSGPLSGPGSPLVALLAESAERCARLARPLLSAHPQAGAARLRPWLAALLLAHTPALSLVPADQVEAALDRALALLLGDPRGSFGPTGRRGESSAEPARHQEPGHSRHPDGCREAPPGPQAEPGPEVHAGGLLLLVRPLMALDLLPRPEDLTQSMADLMLLALARVLEPLGAGERAAALERERPLIQLLAPGLVWERPLAERPLADRRSAEHRLGVLVAAIPQGVAFAPGAARRVYGTPTPWIATAPNLGLARTLLRPGRLRLGLGEAELCWPHGAADLALRRAGWDRDPGWVPWLARRVRFRFEDQP